MRNGYGPSQLLLTPTSIHTVHNAQVRNNMVLGKQGRGLGSELCRTTFQARKKPSGCTVRYVRRWIVPIHNAHRLESLPHGYAIPKPCARGNPRVVDHIGSGNFRSHERIFCKDRRPRNHQKLLTMLLPTVVSMLMSTSTGTSLTRVNLLSNHGSFRVPGTHAPPIPCPEPCRRFTAPVTRDSEVQFITPSDVIPS